MGDYFPKEGRNFRSLKANYKTEGKLIIYRWIGNSKRNIYALLTFFLKIGSFPEKSKAFSVRDTFVCSRDHNKRVSEKNLVGTRINVE